LAATITDAPPRVGKAAAAWHALPQELIDGGEIVILAIKPSMWRPLLDSWPWILTACVFALITTTWPATIPGLSVMATAQVILLVAACRLGVAIVRWIPTWYVLTNRRILTIQGVRAPRFTACPLPAIGNVELSTTPSERLTRLGTVLFAAQDERTVIQLWRSIARPEEIHARVRRAIDEAHNRQRGA
jgi:membrane protein YdbS with pleckstrin-like domain